MATSSCDVALTCHTTGGDSAHGVATVCSCVANSAPGVAESALGGAFSALRVAGR